MKYKVLIIIAFVSFIFYWFQIRPATIRSECGELAKHQIKEQGAKGFLQTVESADDFYTFRYKICLNERGLSK